MTDKVQGMSLKSFAQKLIPKRRHESQNEFFGSKTTTPVNRLRTDIKGLSDDELINLLTHELIRRQVKDGFLADLGKKIQKTKHTIKIEGEKKRKEHQERIIQQKSPFNKFRLLAQQNSVTRVDALNEWPLSDLKTILKQIADKRRLEGVPAYMLRRAKLDLVNVIQEKTALEE